MMAGRGRAGRVSDGASGVPQGLVFRLLSWWQVAGLSGLLILPVLAVLRLTEFFDWRYVVAGAAIVSLWSYVAVVMDKRKAHAGRWRTPESTLHLLELLGGWPGSFLAQRQFRHKVSKTSYQVVFWLIVLINQVMAFDFVNDWRYAGQLWSLLM